MSEAYVPTPADMQRDKVRGILLKGMELLDVKGHDYAADDSAFINFTLTGMILDWAVSRGLQQEDLAFVSFIATKLARLIELRGSGKTPKNETIEDTCMDLANYAALWGGWILTKRKSLTTWIDEVRRVPESVWMRFKEWADKEDDRLQTAKEYEEWTVGKEGEYPDLDLVSVSERHENFWTEMTKKYASTKDEPDLDLEAAREARGHRD